MFAIGATGAGVIADGSRSCIVGFTDEHHWDTSAAVFFGRAVEQEFVSGATGTDTATTFHVEEQWKGDPRPTLAVRTCGGRDRICGPSYTFVVGERYLVFAWDDPLQTSECTLTKKAAEAGPVIEWLRQRGR